MSPYTLVMLVLHKNLFAAHVQGGPDHDMLTLKDLYKVLNFYHRSKVTVWIY